MALVTGRFLSPESAALLDTLIEDEFAESEEVREVETVARRRAFGSQLATAQRKAIEDRAVKACNVIGGLAPFGLDGRDGLGGH